MRIVALVSVCVILFSKIFMIHSLTCADVLLLPSDKKLTLLDLQTIQPKDMIECLAHLGKEKMAFEEADYIWQSIIKYYNGIDRIPDRVLMILHWVTTAVRPEHYENLTLDNIDVVENFGLNYNLESQQLTAIADRVREDFAGKDFEDYTYYDLMAMKQILCQFNRSEIERIHPSAYRQAAIMVGKLENCAVEAMTGFATLAMDAAGFGSPAKWSKAIIKTIGRVANYLPPEIKERFKVDINTDDHSTT